MHNAIALALCAAADAKGTIVTGLSSNHLAELKGMLASAQRVLPDMWRVSVYDLVDDLKPVDVQLLNSYCGVTVKPFPGTMDFRYLASSAWKVHIIEAELDLLMPQDFVLYVDAGMQFARQWIPSTIFVAAREQGVVGIKTAGPAAARARHTKVVMRDKTTHRLPCILTLARSQSSRQ